jgi:GTP-binding protein
VPKGGPDGGDGGKGGSIIFRTDDNVDNLTDFFYAPILTAKNGNPGRGRNCYGKASPDRIYHVPVGTLIYRLPDRVPVGDAAVEAGDGLTFIDFSRAPEQPGVVESKPEADPAELELVADLDRPGIDFVLCAGGIGGKGNTHFKSSRNRVPTQFTEGTLGESGTFYVELRKIADAGLVGYPNAGKSTLLSAISQARPKIASYPFTTLTPHVGVVERPEYQRYTVADIPGLIEGAHRNVGLGHEFLRHIKRCKILVLLIDMAGTDGRNPWDDYKQLIAELELYDAAMLEKPIYVVGNKMDEPAAEENLKKFKRRIRKTRVLPIAAAFDEGIDLFKAMIRDAVAQAEQAEAVEPLNRAKS